MFLIHGRLQDTTYTAPLNPSGRFNAKQYGPGAYGALAAQRLANTVSDLPLSIRYSPEGAKGSFQSKQMTADQKFNLIAFTHELMEAVAHGPVLKGLSLQQAAKFVTALLDFSPPAPLLDQPLKKAAPTSAEQHLFDLSQDLLEASIETIDQNKDGHYSVSELATFVHFVDGIGINLRKGDPDYANSDHLLESDASLDALADKLDANNNILNPDGLNPINEDSDQDGKLSAFERKVALDYLIHSEDGLAMFNRLRPLSKRLKLQTQINPFLIPKRYTLN
jgi:hypothetical protein